MKEQLGYRVKAAGKWQVEIPRAELSAPMTDIEQVIVEMLGGGKHNYSSIGELMNVTKYAIKFHVQRAARKIPGDLPAQLRVVAWYRGATLEVLGALPLSSPASRTTQESNART